MLLLLLLLSETMQAQQSHLSSQPPGLAPFRYAQMLASQAPKEYELVDSWAFSAKNGQPAAFLSREYGFNANLLHI